jgi:hypothetical protein
MQKATLGVSNNLDDAGFTQPFTEWATPQWEKLCRQLLMSPAWMPTASNPGVP